MLVIFIAIDSFDGINAGEIQSLGHASYITLGAMHAGTISSVGMHHDAQFSFSPAEGYDKNIRYLNGRCPARLYMDELLARLARGDEALLATGKLVSHRVRLTDERAVLEVYDKFDKQADNCVKVVISAS